MEDLGVLSVQSGGFGLNDFGQVVGVSSGIPFLYSNGQMMNLNNLVVSNSGWVLSWANGINNAGQIVGYGTNPSGQQDAYLLNPVGMLLPVIAQQSGSQTVAIGSTIQLSVSVINEPVSYQWYLGTNVIDGATNALLTLTNVQTYQSGTYTVAVSDQAGTVTSDPIMLSILPSLGINMVPAISIAGTIGAVYQLEYVNMLGPTNDWQLLETVTITNNPQYYFDVSAIGQPKRFYQLVQVQ